MNENRKIEMIVGEILNRKPSDLALIALLKEKVSDAQEIKPYKPAEK